MRTRRAGIPSIPPHRITTEGLVVRCWCEEDAPLLRSAIDSSLDHLRAWMPWALDEPKSLDETRSRLSDKAEEFESGDDFHFGIFDRQEREIVGACGLHPGIGDDGLEIGYWIRADRTNRGLATEAARALTTAALRLPGIARVQIHCDPENGASARIPEKLGFRLVERRRENKQTPDGKPRDTLVFETTAGEWHSTEDLPSTP